MVITSAELPATRAAAAEQLGQLADWQSLPDLLTAMQDANPIVRARAGVAAQKIAGADYGFDADGPAQQRNRIIETLRRYYEARKNQPPSGT